MRRNSKTNTRSGHMSGERRDDSTDSCVAKASCLFQPKLRSGERVGYSTMDTIREAASELITVCALRRGQGGIAFKLGEYCCKLTSVR